MPVDMQVVFPQVLVPLTGVKVLPGLLPRTLDVTGEDFRTVDEVIVNDRASPSVVVLSKTRMLVQVPDNVLDRVTSITVVSNRLVLADKSLLRFRLGRTTQRVNGILRLVQLFVKVLFTTPGRDIWVPQFGGGGLRNLGRNFSAQASQSIISDFIISVDTAAKQIIAVQAKEPRTPPEERLLKATVLRINYNKNEAALIPTVELVNQTGRPALASLSL